MNADTKIPHDDKDLNPTKKVHCEKLVNCFVHLSVMAATGNPCKVFCPELACILQCISNLCIAASWEVFNFPREA